MLTFSAALIAAVAAGWGLVYLGNQVGGVLRWMCFIAGGALLLGVLLYGSALQGEVRRTMGPLPIGTPGKDLESPRFQGRRLEAGSRGHTPQI